MKKLTARTFSARIQEKPITLVKISSPYCLPCKWLSLTMQQLAQKWSQHATFLSLEVARQGSTTLQQNAELYKSLITQAASLPGKQDLGASVPKILLFKNGQLHTMTDGIDWAAVRPDLPEDRSDADALEQFVFKHMYPTLDKALHALMTI